MQTECPECVDGVIERLRPLILAPNQFHVRYLRCWRCHPAKVTDYISRRGECFERPEAMPADQRYLIQKAPDEFIWLDGYGGGVDWEWNQVRASSWRLRAEEAHKKLKLLQAHFPNAFIVEA